MADEFPASEGAIYPRGFSRSIKWRWPLMPARDLVTLNYGRSLKASTRLAGTVPVFGTNGQCGWHNEALARGPGLILGRKGQGPLGVEWCDSDFWVIDTAYYASTLTNNIDLKYLYHLVKYIGLNHLKDGTSNPGLSRDSFGAQLFPFPPLGEQQAIAAVLSALDDKIEVNRRMNDTLEAMARALFQSWFVHFDPVRADLEDRQPSGLDPKVAGLFPSEFVDTDMGRIPRGWTASVLDDLAELILGGDWGASSPKDEETLATACIRGADIPSLQDGGLGKMATRYLKPSSVAKRQLAAGDLVVEISGGSPTQSTGRPVLASDGLLKRVTSPIVCSNFCRVVKLKSPDLSYFVYLWLRTLYDAGEFFAFETGTTGIKNLAFTRFASTFRVALPSPSILRHFNEIVSPLMERHQANGGESECLSNLRETLLPKLLSGELSVEMADAIAKWV